MVSIRSESLANWLGCVVSMPLLRMNRQPFLNCSPAYKNSESVEERRGDMDDGNCIETVTVKL